MIGLTALTQRTRRTLLDACLPFPRLRGKVPVGRMGANL